MNITVTLDWSLEEITIALNAIEAHKKRSESILPIRVLPETKVVIPEEKKKKTWPVSGSKSKRPIDIFMGSVESWFAYHKTFESITAVSKYLGQKHPANISPYVRSWSIFKWIYKFKYHA